MLLKPERTFLLDYRMFKRENPELVRNLREVLDELAVYGRVSEGYRTSR